jgi:hypothetical protein
MGEAKYVEQKKAFNAFDIDKNGKISSDEIFRFLATLGYNLTEEGKDRIMKFYKEVDTDGSGDLDFCEFEEFLKKCITAKDENEKKAQAAANEQRRHLETDGIWIPYARLFNIKVATNRSSAGLLSIVALLPSLYCLFHLIASTITLFLGNNWLGMNPQTEAVNTMYSVVEVIRWFNFWSLVFTCCNTCGERNYDKATEVLIAVGYKPTPLNVFKYHCRGMFVIDLVANLFLLGGLQNPAASENIETMGIAISQILCVYISLSYFGYFDSVLVPIRFQDQIKIFFVDMAFFNAVRLVIILVKTALSLVLLPVVILFLLAYCFALCFGGAEKCGDPSNPYSCAGKFFICITKLMT